MDVPSGSYATAQDMAAKYRIGVDTVRRKVQTGEWPCDRIGRHYRFSPTQQDEIAQVIAGARISGYDKDRIAVALRKLSG
ncbi:excisionase family DNA binding protein [Arthrobacter sp. SLBN-112]|jgi:excisionase family DNA binding protein|nr:excisionase family DNA binding protein [Arthrobacter sp. SLBN-112]